MDVYVTGKITNNIMYYVAYSVNTGCVEGTVPATDNIEGQLYGMGAAIIKVLEAKREPYINVHTDFNSAVKHADGTFKPAGDVSKRFVKKIKSLSKSSGCEFSFDTNLSKERAEKLFELVHPKKEESIEKPLAKKKREIQPNRIYQNWITNKEGTNDKANTNILDEEEIWNKYFAEAENKKKTEQRKETVSYRDPYTNYINVQNGKEVSYDKDDFKWRIRSYDKNGNLKFYLSDRPFPGQTKDRTVIPENDWLAAVWQGCFDEQVKGYTVKREGDFNCDKYKYFFIFGKAGEYLGIISTDKRNLSIQRKSENDNYYHFFDGKVVLDFEETKESDKNKFAGMDSKKAKQYFNEFFETISDDCKKYISDIYINNKEKKRAEEKKEIQTTSEEKTTEQSEENEDKECEEEIDKPNDVQYSLFDL